MLFRDYATADRDACLALFDGNVPVYFAAEERTGYEAFLDALPGPYFVVEDTGGVVACGGYALEGDTGETALCWGMVDARRHREGIGSLFAAERLRRAVAEGAWGTVVLRTGPRTADFYARLGFEVSSVVPNGHAPGIDCVEMRLR
jgi:GNAT superfamily N-acetyltransferase